MTTRSQPQKTNDSTDDDISTASFPFLMNQGIVLKLFILFVLAFSRLSLVAGIPTTSESVSLSNNARGEVITLEQLPHPHNVFLPGESEDPAVSEPDRNLRKRQGSAGLFWGPAYVGNLKLYLTNPHDGYAGPKFPSANHVNFHVDQKAPRNSYAPVVNLHIVKYTSAGQSCLYAWDSVTEITVFDNCFDDFGTAILEAVQAARDFVDELLQAADFVASIVIIAALIVALVAVLTSLGAVALA